VRFGDYLSKQENHSIYGLVKPDYYVNAIRYLSDKTGLSHVCIVSDEPEQAVALLTPALSLLPDITLHSSHGSTLEYFCILASSKALVTTNSTFSWWAAWLAHMQNSATVIFPTPWFVDSRESAGLAYPTWIPLNRDSN
jgi:hypothetical protein